MCEKSEEGKFEALRELAEKALAERKPGDQPPSLEETRSLLHELQVHQIELEMQNDELRRAQESLEISRQRYSDLYNNAPVGYLTLDGNGIVSQANRTFGRLANTQIGNIVNRPFALFVHGEDREHYYKHYGKLVRRGTLQGAEVRLQGNEDPPVWVRLDGRLAEPPESGRTEYRLVVTEVSEVRKAQDALRASEERLRLIVENMPVMLYAVDDKMAFVMWNRECERVTGYSADEIVGNPQALELLYDRPGQISEVRARMGKGGLSFRDWETTLTSKDGSCHTIAWFSLAGDVSVPGWHSWAFGVDLTERHRLEQQRQQLDKQIQQAQKLESLCAFAGGAAHDFNNILMSILGNAELALSDLSPLSPARENLSEIENSALRAADLSRAMLAFSGKAHLNVRRFDISEALGEMRYLLETGVRPGILVQFHLADGLPEIQADLEHLRQIAVNLVANASEAIEEGQSGVITVRTGCEDCDRDYLQDIYMGEGLAQGQYVYLQVTDTGCGMDDSVRRRVFDPFFTTKFPGRGLGLAATFGIVRGHGGGIVVYSEPGHGSNFKVLFPAGEKAESPSVQAGNGNPLSRSEPPLNGRVLLIDDEVSVRTVAEKMLERIGLEVTAAPDGEEGARELKGRPDGFDLIILDYVLPGSNGDEAFRQLRRINEKIPIFVSSGYGSEEVLPRFAGMDYAGFIPKPYQIAGLRKALSQVLNDRENAVE